jgi:hypothetical protein
MLQEDEEAEGSDTERNVVITQIRASIMTKYRDSILLAVLKGTNESAVSCVSVEGTVKLFLQQAVETHGVVTHQGAYIFSKVGSQIP